MVERQTDAKRIPLFPQRSLENIIPRSSTKLMAGTALSSILDGTTTVVVISQALEERISSRRLETGRTRRGGNGEAAVQRRVADEAWALGCTVVDVRDRPADVTMT
jgi:hypothetical protein